MRCPARKLPPECVAASADGECHFPSPNSGERKSGAERDLQAMFAGPGKLRAGERRGAPRHTRGGLRAGGVGSVLGGLPRGKFEPGPWEDVGRLRRRPAARR